MTTTTTTVTVIGGVDTHKHTHYAAAIDDQGRLLGHQEFPASDTGYDSLLAWLRGHGTIDAIGVESTGSFGATLTRALTAAGEQVVEVNRPNRIARRMDGKSDRLDAEQIARAVLGRTSTATPKTKSGVVEVIRTLRVTRTSAVKARTQAFNTLWGVMIGAPSPLRDELVVLTKKTLVNRCLGLRPETGDLITLAADPDRLLMAGVKVSLRDLARRWKALDDEVKTLNQQIELLVRSAAPELVQLHGVGTEIAGQFLVTVGDNSDRIRNEAAFAKLCGVAPQPASSGRTSGRHRLSEGATGPRTAPSTSSRSFGCAITNQPATTSNAARQKGSANARSSAASSATSPERSTQTCPSQPLLEMSSPKPLDEHRSIERFHQTMKKWLAAQPPAADLVALQRQLARFLRYYNTMRPHRALDRRTPAQAYDARTKATPAKPSIGVHYRVRRDKVDTGGVITIRYDSKLRHIGLGREHTGTRVLALIADRYVRVVDAETGELLRELTLDPTKDYQPLGRQPGPPKKKP